MAIHVADFSGSAMDGKRVYVYHVSSDLVKNIYALVEFVLKLVSSFKASATVHNDLWPTQ